MFSWSEYQLYSMPSVGFWTLVCASIISYRPELMFMGAACAILSCFLHFAKSNEDMRQNSVLIGYLLVWLVIFWFSATRAYNGYSVVLAYYTPVLAVIFLTLSTSSPKNFTPTIIYTTFLLSFFLVYQDYLFLYAGILSSGEQFKAVVYMMQFSGEGIWSFNRLAAGAAFAALLATMLPNGFKRNLIFSFCFINLCILASFMSSRLSFFAACIALILFMKDGYSRRKIQTAVFSGVLIFVITSFNLEALVQRVSLFGIGDDNRFFGFLSVARCSSGMEDFLLGAPECIRTSGLRDVDSLFLDLFLRTGFISIILFSLGLGLTFLLSKGDRLTRIMIALFAVFLYLFDSSLSKPEFLAPFVLLYAAGAKYDKDRDIELGNQGAV